MHYWVMTFTKTPVIKVHGASGAQGGPVVAKLEQLGYRPVGLAREATMGSSSQAVNLADVDSVRTVYADADAIFVQVPLGDGPTRARQFRTIAAALEGTLVQRLVITDSAVTGDPAAYAPDGPEPALAELVNTARGLGISHAVIRSKIFLENLLLPAVQGPLAEKNSLEYPFAPDFKVSWVSHEDVAAVAAHLLTESRYEGEVHVGHLPGITGQGLAISLGRALGRDITYREISPAEWGARNQPLFGEAMAQMLDQMYTHLSAQDSHEIPVEKDAGHRLGIYPRDPQAWAQTHLANN